MEQQQLQVFIESVIEYFNKMTDTPVEVHVPFLKDEKQSVLLSHTGVIGISGAMRGAIYFTADDKFLADLVDRITPGVESSDQHLSAMVGELANTIAGNAQRTLGSDYHISIPIVFTTPDARQKNTLELKAATFVVPLRWHGHDAYLAAGLEKEG
jgi:chemotaxis protein CheX